jgi:serine/threonine protein kinase/WD40 repeat protein
MSENIESRQNPMTELPTVDGPTLHGRRVVANRYEILSRLGQGGMGEVWHAYDLKLRVDVALKSLRRTTPDAVEALRREVRTAREVISPNVCRIFDLVEAQQELISMEYIDGITLTSMLVKKGPMQLREARDIAAQFLAGLEAIHQSGLVHRDLKPENIMITRTGRVVVMDFGIAKQVAQLGGTIAGTVPYMSPEQLAGEKVDTRSDVFSAGVVLAEMIHPEGVYSQKTREQIWNAVRKTPLQIPDSPWKAVIAKAVAQERENRFASAGALARALEEVTLRVETIEERKPYPGLASFTAADAEYFYGRELEVETVIKKMQQLHLMALIGPSGAGKTSFLRAGLIPVLPADWTHIFCTPGDSPLVNLGQSLVPALSGDTEAMQKMVRLEDSNTALWLVHRWKAKYKEAVLIVDRFEELFTLNSRQIQSGFSELLGRAALEADVHVLLVMRDDFLFHCHDQSQLAPIFSELTPLGSLTGAALRRALVQPALRCNYRFEDETLVDEIITDIEKERGALPLMAFAASRLWEKRDRQSGTLTRSAYREIGGVAGALAQHAEQTMERIGTEHQPIVREIFRNLITAQNTRAARDTEELLSVFPEKQTAEEVLRILIDARLLTSFETADGEQRRSRVEIIHESLLSNWPRLVRWQTQDADSAQLRDQLRQAAQLWEQRNRSEDLLWTGAAYLDFQAWRQHYPGGLSSTEEAFARGMMNRATRRRRQRRLAVGSLIILLLTVLAVVSVFWEGEKSARQQALSEAKRVEASKLVTLGRLQLDGDRSVALAYALASAELADTSETRHFALEALSQGPPSQLLDMPITPDYVEFSPDGRWLAAGGWGGVRLVPSDGSATIVLEQHWDPRIGTTRRPHFSPDSDLVIWVSGEDQTKVKIWSISQRRQIRTLKMEGETRSFVRAGTLFLLTGNTEEFAGEAAGKARFYGTWKHSAIWIWNFDQSEPKLLSRRVLEPIWSFDIDSTGKWFVYPKGKEIYIFPTDNSGKEQLVGKHNQNVREVKFYSHGHSLASSDTSGEVRIWSIVMKTNPLVRVIEPGGQVWDVVLNSSGTVLAAIDPFESGIRLLDLTMPREPMLLKRADSLFSGLAYDPAGRCLVSTAGTQLQFFNTRNEYPYVFKKNSMPGTFVAFISDGKSLLVGSQHEGVHLQKLGETADVTSSPIVFKPESPINDIDLEPSGEKFVMGTWRQGVLLASLATGKMQQLPGPPRLYCSVSMSPDGLYAAGASYLPGSSDSEADYSRNDATADIQIWNLQTEEMQTLADGKLKYPVFVQYGSDDRVFSGDFSGRLIEWNVRNRTSRLVQKGDGPVNSLAISKSLRYLLASISQRPRKGVYPGKSETIEVILHDLREGTSKKITSHGNRVVSLGFGNDDKMIVTGDYEGIVRIGPITGEEPYLLFGHRGPVSSVEVDPNGEWIASASGDSSERLWRMPEGQPFHTLPYNELLDRLRRLTNVRVVEDKNSPNGYRVTYAPFPGWEKVTSW